MQLIWNDLFYFFDSIKFIANKPPILIIYLLHSFIRLLMVISETMVHENEKEFK